jgi:hypothetical protein
MPCSLHSCTPGPRSDAAVVTAGGDSVQLTMTQENPKRPPAFGFHTLRSSIWFKVPDALPQQLAHQVVVHLAFHCATGAKEPVALSSGC